MLQKTNQFPALLTGDSVHLAVGIDPSCLHHLRNHFLWQQVIQGVAEIVVAVFLKIRQQTLVQLSLIQRRLQVNFKAVGLFFEPTHMRGSRQHQRTADAEMGEQQLTKIGVNFLVIFKDCQLYVPQAQSLHGGTGIALFPQRYQRALQRRDRMAQLCCHSMSLTGRAGGRIGNAAGSQNHRVARIAPLFTNYAVNAVIIGLQRCGTVTNQLHLQCPQTAFQRAADIKGTVGHGEHSVAPFRFQRHTQTFKKRDGIPTVKAGESAVQKLSVLGNVGHERFQICVVGHVAAAFSGDVQFLAQTFIGLQQRD